MINRQPKAISGDSPPPNRSAYVQGSSIALKSKRFGRGYYSVHAGNLTIFGCSVDFHLNVFVRAKDVIRSFWLTGWLD